MSERPIIFSGESVRAILADRKTMTRRVDSAYYKNWKVGDLLWVRESFWQVKLEWEQHELVLGQDVIHNGWYWSSPKDLDIEGGDTLDCIRRFDMPDKTDCSVNWAFGAFWEKRPAIFMPKWAARIWLEITAIRVERLQTGIVDEYSLDPFKEGICEICEDEKIRYDKDPMGEPPQYCGGNGGMGCFVDYKDLFRQLWDSLNAKRGYGWDINPEVKVISFKKVKESRGKK